MKLARVARRHGGPSDKFLERQAAKRIADAQILPASGPVRLYLDDERLPPPGWTLVRSSAAFFQTLAALVPGRLENLSLDWHLGADEMDGEAVASRLLDVMRESPETFSALDFVFLHSAKPEGALAMLRTLETPLQEDWSSIPYYGIDVGSPDPTGTDVRMRPRR